MAKDYRRRSRRPHGRQSGAEPHDELRLDPEEPVCPRCLKPMSLSVCEDIAPLDNHVTLLILQHPQEQDKALGTARLAALNLKNATVKVGLSWPSLAKVLGREADPRRWAVLYLGAADEAGERPKREVSVLDSKGHLMPDQDRSLGELEGIIVLDGTWSQAKTLWWRNPWVLKTRRLVLEPKRASRYGKLRREPRRQGLSTLEAAALALSRIEKRPEIETQMTASFEKLLDRYRMLLAAQRQATAAGAAAEK
jgi:DTW domain-containing protein YfiP